MTDAARTIVLPEAGSEAEKRLVEAMARAIAGDHPTSWSRRPDDKRILRELVRGGVVSVDTVTRADYRDDACTALAVLREFEG